MKHGTSKKVIVRSLKSKLPSEFSQFLSCGENKNRLIELLFEVIKTKGKKIWRCYDVINWCYQD